MQFEIARAINITQTFEFKIEWAFFIMVLMGKSIKNMCVLLWSF